MQLAKWTEPAERLLTSCRMLCASEDVFPIHSMFPLWMLTVWPFLAEVNKQVLEQDVHYESCILAHLALGKFQLGACYSAPKWR